PEVDVALENDPLFAPRSVERGEAVQRLAHSTRNKGQVRELDAVTLFELSAFAIAESRDGGHIDLDQDACMRRGVAAAHPVLRNRAPRRREGNDGVALPGGKGGSGRSRTDRRGGARSTSRCRLLHL